MQCLQFHAIDVPAVAALDDFNGKPALFERRERLLHARGFTFGKRRRGADAADRKTIRELRNAVEMIEIAVREYKFIDVPDAARPEERGDVAARHIGARRGAGV